MIGIPYPPTTNDRASGVADTHYMAPPNAGVISYMRAIADQALGILVAALLRVVNGAIIGQASTLILVLFMGGVQLIFLGIIGEYLGRIYDEVRARPLYVVRDVLGSES